MIKSPEELRTSQGLNQSQFSQTLNISRRCYNARLMQEQDWKLTELIKLCELGDGKVLVSKGSCSYVVSIKMID